MRDARLYGMALLVGLVAAALCATATMAQTGGSYVPPPAVKRSCFPAKLWNVTEKEWRPCYTISQPAEDGSGWLEVGSANGRRSPGSTVEASICDVPNPSEEKRVFYIRCYPND